MSYDYIIDNFQWSFSRLNSFQNCPYAWYLTYIENIKGEDGFFSEYGTLIHGILEKYAKGELEIYELVDEYVNTYKDVVCHDAPPNAYVDLGQKYYDVGLQYLENFEGFGEYEVVAVEKEIFVKIDDIAITGYIDLLLKDKDGKFIILDHKSSAIKTKTSKKAKEYLKQMILYSIGIYQEFGEYPKELHINAFREGKVYIYKFEEEMTHAVVVWIKETIKMITSQEKFHQKVMLSFVIFYVDIGRIVNLNRKEYL